MVNSNKEQTVSGFMINPFKQTQAMREGRRDFLDDQRKKVSHSGPLVHGIGWTRTEKELDNPHMVSGRNNLSTISGLVATRTTLPGERHEKPGVSQPEAGRLAGGLQGPLNRLESTTKQDRNCQMQNMAGSPQARAEKSRTREPNLVSS